MRHSNSAGVAGDSLPRARGGHALNAIYGSNDWYYAYGRNTADGILRDADLMRELAPAGATQPFTIVDDGYQDRARFRIWLRLRNRFAVVTSCRECGFDRCGPPQARRRICCCRTRDGATGRSAPTNLPSTQQSRGACRRAGCRPRGARLGL